MSKTDKATSLEEKINSYFLYCDELNEGKKNIVKPYTLSGLLCHTGLSREDFEKLMKAGRRKAVLDRALSKIEAFIEENMLTGALSCNASLNSLKCNFGWGEKQDTANDETVRTITVTLPPEIAELAR